MHSINPTTPSKKNASSTTTPNSSTNNSTTTHNILTARRKERTTPSQQTAAPQLPSSSTPNRSTPNQIASYSAVVGSGSASSTPSSSAWPTSPPNSSAAKHVLPTTSPPANVIATIPLPNDRIQQKKGKKIRPTLIDASTPLRPPPSAHNSFQSPPSHSSFQQQQQQQQQSYYQQLKQQQKRYSTTTNFTTATTSNNNNNNNNNAWTNRSDGGVSHPNNNNSSSSSSSSILPSPNSYYRSAAVFADATTSNNNNNNLPVATKPPQYQQQQQQQHHGFNHHQQQQHHQPHRPATVPTSSPPSQSISEPPPPPLPPPISVSIECLSQMAIEYSDRILRREVPSLAEELECIFRFLTALPSLDASSGKQTNLATTEEQQQQQPTHDDHGAATTASNDSTTTTMEKMAPPPPPPPSSIAKSIMLIGIPSTVLSEVVITCLPKHEPNLPEENTSSPNALLAGVFYYTETCHVFACIVLERIERILHHLEKSIVKLLYENEVLKSINGGLCARLEETFVKRNMMFSSSEYQFSYDVHMNDDASALSFRPEFDSRNSCKTQEEQLLFSNREKCRDMFYNLLQNNPITVHDQQAHRSNFRKGPTPTASTGSRQEQNVKVFISTLKEANYEWFSTLFVSKLLQDCLQEEVDPALTHLAKDVEKLQKLNKRFTIAQSPPSATPVSSITTGPASTTNAPTSTKRAASQQDAAEEKDTMDDGGPDSRSSTLSTDIAGLFPERQEMFFRLIQSGDSFMLNRHIIAALSEKMIELCTVQDTTTLNKPLNPYMFEITLYKLRVLAKFLGYLVFSPSWSMLSTPHQHGPFSTSARHNNRICAFGGLTTEILERVKKARGETSSSSSSLVLTVPWVVEYLKMMRPQMYQMVSSNASDAENSSSCGSFRELQELFNQLFQVYEHLSRPNDDSEYGYGNPDFNINHLYVCQELEDLFKMLNIPSSDRANAIKDLPQRQGQLDNTQTSSGDGVNLATGSPVIRRSVYERTVSAAAGVDSHWMLIQQGFLVRCWPALDRLKTILVDYQAERNKQLNSYNNNVHIRRRKITPMQPSNNRNIAFIGSANMATPHHLPSMLTGLDKTPDGITKTGGGENSSGEKSASTSPSSAGWEIKEKLKAAFFHSNPKLEQIVKMAVETVVQNSCTYVLDRYIAGAVDEIATLISYRLKLDAKKYDTTDSHQEIRNALVKSETSVVSVCVQSASAFCRERLPQVITLLSPYEMEKHTLHTAVTVAVDMAIRNVNAIVRERVTLDFRRRLERSSMREVSTFIKKLSSSTPDRQKLMMGTSPSPNIVNMLGTTARSAASSSFTSTPSPIVMRDLTTPLSSVANSVLQRTGSAITMDATTATTRSPSPSSVVKSRRNLNRLFEDSQNAGKPSDAAGGEGAIVLDKDQLWIEEASKTLSLTWASLGEINNSSYCRAENNKSTRDSHAVPPITTLLSWSEILEQLTLLTVEMCVHIPSEVWLGECSRHIPQGLQQQQQQQQQEPQQQQQQQQAHKHSAMIQQWLRLWRELIKQDGVTDNANSNSSVFACSRVLLGVLLSTAQLNTFHLMQPQAQAQQQEQQHGVATTTTTTAPNSSNGDNTKARRHRPSTGKEATMSPTLTTTARPSNSNSSSSSSSSSSSVGLVVDADEPWMDSLASALLLLIREGVLSVVAVEDRCLQVLKEHLSVFMRRRQQQRALLVRATSSAIHAFGAHRGAPTTTPTNSMTAAPSINNNSNNTPVTNSIVPMTMVAEEYGDDDDDDEHGDNNDLSELAFVHRFMEKLVQGYHAVFGSPQKAASAAITTTSTTAAAASSSWSGHVYHPLYFTRLQTVVQAFINASQQHNANSNNTNTNNNNNK